MGSDREPDDEVDEVDESERESFPASDPPASWAGADRVPPDGSDGAAPGTPD